MKCYFCQGTIYDTNKNGFFDCDECAEKITSGKGSVIHVTDGQGLLYVHIFIERPLTQDAGTDNFGHWVNVIRERTYHFWLYLRDDYTDFKVPNDVGYDIFKITGFPVNPSNVDEKLKLYLLFL